MVNHGERELPYVVVDVEHYREKRFEKIESIARRAAQKAVRSRRDVPLKAMSPEDRKLVHNLLKSFDGVSTFSKGKEGERNVIVSPEIKSPHSQRKA
jgi:spoIIIJ-associated protein